MNMVIKVAVYLINAAVDFPHKIGQLNQAAFIVS